MKSYNLCGEAIFPHQSHTHLKEEPSPAKLSRIAGGTEDMDTEERMGSINMSIREFNKRYKKRWSGWKLILAWTSIAMLIIYIWILIIK